MTAEVPEPVETIDGDDYSNVDPSEFPNFDDVDSTTIEEKGGAA